MHAASFADYDRSSAAAEAHVADTRASAPPAARAHLCPGVAVEAPHEEGQLAVEHEVEVAHLVARGVPRAHHVVLRRRGTVRYGAVQSSGTAAQQ